MIKDKKLFSHGFLPIYKPIKYTSHDCVAIARKKLNIKQIGHCGTLDPFAEGLLILTIGKATKLQSYLMSANKKYHATCFMGKETDSCDHTGKTIKIWNGQLSDIKTDTIHKKLILFKGFTSQIPPLHCAIKIDGKKGYEYIRMNQSVKIPPRLIRIDEISITNRNDPYLSFDITCAKGTYIRALARDLGYALGCYAHLTQLVRSRCGEFELSKATPLEQIDNSKIIPVDKGISLIKEIQVSQSEYQEKLKYGQWQFLFAKKIILTKDGFIGIYYQNILIMVIDKNQQNYKLVYFNNEITQTQ